MDDGSRFTAVTPADVLVLGLIGLIGVLPGCATQGNVVSVVNFRADGPVERLHERFREAYYDSDQQGNVEIVLRTTAPIDSNPAREIVQLITLKTFWKAVPGRTVTHRTQLNATVTYCVISPAVVASYEGVGSLFLTRHKKTKELSGELELARLAPAKVITGGDPVFERCEIQGTFRAVRDARRVTATVNEIERVFGPKERGRVR